MENEKKPSELRMLQCILCRTLDPGLESRQSLYVDQKAQLQCWPSKGQQVSHQKRIWGIHCMQTNRHANEGSTLALKPKADITRNPKQESHSDLPHWVVSLCSVFLRQIDQAWSFFLKRTSRLMCNWWLVKVTLVVAFGYLPQNFGN